MKLILLFTFLLSTLFAETTLCYKNDITQSTLNLTIKLHGSKCENKYSANDMKKNGWTLNSSKVIKNNTNYNHIYIFNKTDKQKNSFMKQNTKKIVPTYNFNRQEVSIYNVTSNSASIDIGNLQVGQSGIIVHKIKSNSIILSQAIVIKSNSKNSIINFVNDKLLQQNAIPTSNIKPSNNDSFILNHLYKTSLLIVPNREAKNTVLDIFKDQNFLNEDFFASHLKLISKPTPSKNIIVNFAQKQQIGTIFIVIKKKLYILDSISFKVIYTVNLDINSQNTNIPFFTKIDAIEKGFWTFGNNEMSDYNNYYLSLINDPSKIEYKKSTTTSFLTNLIEMF